jgi:hypothetical protein
MASPLTREELDLTECGSRNCFNHDHSVLFLTCKTHLGSPGQVSYHKMTGTIRVTCDECKRQIAEVAVAETHQNAIRFYRGH